MGVLGFGIFLIIILGVILQAKDTQKKDEKTNRPPAQREQGLSATEKSDMADLEDKGTAFGKTLLNHPMLHSISTLLADKFIDTIEKDIAIVNQNTCKSYYYFYVEHTGVTWPKSVVNSTYAGICLYSDYNVSVVEDEYKLHGIAWALNSLIVPKIRVAYPQIANWRIEKSSNNGRISNPIF